MNGCDCYNHIDKDSVTTQIVYCPLHAAAPQMYDALKTILRALPSNRFLGTRKKVIEAISPIKRSLK